MEICSSVNPLILSQPSCVDTIKALHQQRDTKKDDLVLKKASQDFESILINFVVSSLWKTIQKSDLSGESDGGLETYTEIMHATLSQDIAAKGGLGVAPLIYEQLIRNKEVAEVMPEDVNCMQESLKKGTDRALYRVEVEGTKGVRQP